ncbi:DUF7832 domain-containing protein [Isobaculum melis]|uniref:DUF7832 domain-containing protein n=1 Tax=Isobaculum melis TaxID=142588 RepID=A0A1H9T3Z7_9LACT|nr:hypothetical protein [Isobaculum melis]SER91868.1 hypothetical protein SAMN04488559_110110 [Isobaculum melis]
MAYDKAKWHFDAEDFPKEIDIEQGGVHIAFFYRWMLEQGFAGEDLLEDMLEEVELVKNGKYSALDLLFEFNDGVLLEEDFNTAGMNFANQYYEAETPFAEKYAFYLKDYGELDLNYLEGIEASAYGVIYSDENYQKVKKVLDLRYQEFLDFEMEK